MTHVNDVVDGLCVEQPQFHGVVRYVAYSLTEALTDDQLAVAVQGRAGAVTVSRRRRLGTRWRRQTTRRLLRCAAAAAAAAAFLTLLLSANSHHTAHSLPSVVKPDEAL